MVEKIKKVVSNSSPIIYLSIVYKFYLLKDLFQQVLISHAVYEEIVTNGKGRPGHKETLIALEQGWLKKKEVSDILTVKVLCKSLAKGESESIVLCKEENGDIVILDDLEARNEAEFIGLNVTGTLGILKLAKIKGLSLKELLDKLHKQGFRISKILYDRILKE